MRLAAFGRLITALGLLLPFALGTPRHLAASPRFPLLDAGDVVGTVSDSTNGQPLQGGEISVMRDSRLVANTVADEFGRFVIHDLAAGSYTVQARLIGYKPESREVTVSAGGATITLAFRLQPAAVGLQAITVNAQAPIAVDTRSGDQVFKQNDYHGAPTNTTSQILQQSIVGAARAPTGEVHIRGQHAEYTYYVDGVPVPSGISGSLNELFDPAVVDRIDFQTGGWDAEYGDKNAAVINVLTRIPTGRFHADLSSYAGSFNTNGQGLSLSGNAGKWGLFVSGARQETGMRQEPVLFDTATNAPINFHNHGEDLYTFGKVQYKHSDRDMFGLDLNWSRTRFAVPFDSTGGALLDDHQQDINSFANLSWRHRFGGDTATAEAGSDLFVGAFARHGSLTYDPGPNDDPSFVFFPDPTAYNLAESRTFDTYGTKIDYRWRPSHAAEFKVGTLASTTSGHENFVTTAADGSHGPASNSGLDGHDVGVYAQTALSPVEWFELRTGVRYDTHVAPFAGNQHQVSPRVKLTFYPDPANTFYLYYGRLFIPTNIEDLRAITSAADSGVVAEPTLPERDDFYEIGYIHRFPIGIVAKLSGYYKESSPGIDDNTVPGSAITTSVNLERVYIRGIESVIEIRPPGPVSGYVNFAINHAYGRGPITGGFFPTDVADVPGGWFDLDHDQRISAVASAVYSAHRFYLSTTGIYGTGLTNGADITQPIGRGLFDFNRDIHVDPNFILNASAGYSFVFGNTVVRPQLYVDNVFDEQYLLKGAFFSGASVGRPRSVQVRVNVGI
jgi:hypothetical protein